MHDQKKVREAEIDAKTRQLEQEKIARFRELYAECMGLRAENALTEAALQRVAVLLEVNPELYTMYNYRRRILIALWSDGDAEQKRARLMDEMQLSNRIIQKEYKCYAAWLHRRWVLRELDDETRVALLVKENAKCQALLKVDERNFHVWGYRRWVTNQLVGTPHYDDKAELAFTEAKIGSNFSNYSAWHNRALVFNSLIAAARSGGVNAESIEALHAFYVAESALVVKAMYCDPEDQSAWLYAKTQIYGALRTVTEALSSSSSDSAVRERMLALYSKCLSDARDACLELIDTEDAAAPLKWPRWLLMHLLGGEHAGALGATSPEDAAHRVELLQTLSRIDALRAGYFRDLLARGSS